MVRELIQHAIACPDAGYCICVAVPDCSCLEHAEGFLTCRYVKFDTFHPAVEKGLPVTRVISRVTLQQILAKACTRVAGEDVILNDCRVIDYDERVHQSSKDCAPHHSQQVWHVHQVHKCCTKVISVAFLYGSGLCIGGSRSSEHVYGAGQVNSEGQKKIAAILDDGREFEGDVLIGADGIWSKVGSMRISDDPGPCCDLDRHMMHNVSSLLHTLHCM